MGGWGMGGIEGESGWMEGITQESTNHSDDNPIKAHIIYAYMQHLTLTSPYLTSLTSQ